MDPRRRRDKAPFPNQRRLPRANTPPHGLYGRGIGAGGIHQGELRRKPVRSVGRSDRDLPSTLAALGCALVSHAGLRSLAMHIDDIGLLTVEPSPRGPVSHWEAPCPRSVEAPTAATCPSEPGCTIAYAGRSLGWIQARSARPRGTAGLEPALLDRFARQCGRLAMRERLEPWSLGRLGQPLRLTGLSAAMRDLDRFVEAASASPLPVLLHGEFGTEKLAAAAAIHCCGRPAGDTLRRGRLQRSRR
jgi:hypothetical protein